MKGYLIFALLIRVALWADMNGYGQTCSGSNNAGIAGHCTLTVWNTFTSNATSVTLNQTFIDAILPAGMITPTATSSAATGWLLCDGSAVSRTTYARLFTAIGTTYGVGDGSTTFNLPDLRQRFPLGLATSGTGNTLGGTGGAIDHTHTVDPPNTTSTASANINNVTLLALGSASQPSHTHDVNIAQFNSGTANAPFQVVNYMIKQ